MIKSLTMRPRRPKLVSLNLTPLIDVVFILLIFFMVGTTFKQADAMGVELPEATRTQGSGAQKGIQVGVSSKGHFTLEGRELGANPKDLVKALKELSKKTGRDQPMLIFGDKMAPHQAVVSAMDAARQAGLVRIKIITEPSEKK